MRLRDAGLGAAVAHLAEIARSQVYAATDAIILRKDLEVVEPETHGLTLEEAAERHLPLLADFNLRQGSASRTDRFAAGLAAGRRALLAFRDGELIGYMWWHDATQDQHDFYLARFGVRLEPDEVYGYDLFIAPEHRGRGTPVAFVTGVESELARMGYRAMYGFVDRGNVPARWLWTTTGHEFVQPARTHRFLRVLMRVEGRGWLLVGRRGLRPLGRAR